MNVHTHTHIHTHTRAHANMNNQNFPDGVLFGGNSQNFNTPHFSSKRRLYLNWGTWHGKKGFKNLIRQFNFPFFSFSGKRENVEKRNGRRRNEEGSSSSSNSSNNNNSRKKSTTTITTTTTTTRCTTVWLWKWIWT